MADFTAQELANTASAFAKLGILKQELMSATSVLCQRAREIKLDGLLTSSQVILSFCGYGESWTCQSTILLAPRLLTSCARLSIGVRIRCSKHLRRAVLATAACPWKKISHDR